MVNIMVSKGLGHSLRVNHVRSVGRMIGYRVASITRTKEGTVVSFVGASAFNIGELVQEYL